ncbi:MAG: hypothetical protein K8I27_11420 [Planctomycetes bacterium]|nr:hypothetical protein [Planctomycetota bacterium]
MIRSTCVLVLLLSAAALQGQIFPHIEKEDVKRRITTGKQDPEVEPEPAKPEALDGDKVLRRYNEILDGYIKEERAQKKAMTKHVNDLHVSAQAYLEGVFLLRLGFYEDADKQLDKVGTSVKRESEIKTDQLKQVSDDIKSGKAYYFRMKAAVLRGYTSFEDDDAAVAGWRDAAIEGKKVRDELEKLKDAGRLSGEQDVLKLMTTWMLSARIEWMSLYRLEKKTRDEPANINAWLQLITATGSKQNKLGDEYTPHYLKQRAAIEVVKEFWGTSDYVRGGAADVTLALNAIGCGQLDDWETHLERKDYHSTAGVIVLEGGRKMAGDYKRAIDGLMNK